MRPNIFNIIRESIPFEDVAREYGIHFDQNRKALCPFHSETTPSLHNYQTHGHCFGCGITVDIIDLETHFNGISPFEGALSLARRYRIPLPEFTPSDKEKACKQAEIYKLLQGVAVDANKNMKKHPAVLEFLNSKGLDATDIDRWLIGYVEREDPVTNELKDKSEIELAKEIGLINEYGDYFRKRIVIPVWNYGKVVNLTGRAFPDGKPTYLHLKNSELIQKQIPFVENLGKGFCVVTEGITDAIAFLKADIPAVALLGTYLGEEGRKPLSKAKASLYFCLDNDEAGKEAAYNHAREFNGYILNLEHDKDPDEVLAEKGIKEFKQLAEKAVEEATFYLKIVIEREDTIGALKTIAELEFATERETWLKYLAEKSGITLGALKDDIKRLRQETRTESESEPQSHKPESKPIDLLENPQVVLHPAMALIDGHLAYGTTIRDSVLFICNRKVLDISEIPKEYSLTHRPKPFRFSSYGIKTYVNGAEIKGPRVYEKLYQLLSDHVIFKSLWQIVVIVLWIIGTYLHRIFPIYPYLWIQSPTKRCGKTSLLELISELAFNSEGVQTALTEAVLYRVPTIAADTLCWDELENLHIHKEKGERLEILNSAHRKGAKIPRCEGENHTVKFWEVFRPIALAGISSLPDTVSDRALKIELIRKKRDEKVKRLQIERLRSELQSLRDGLHIFALERTPIILEAYDQFLDDLIPEGVDDRLRDAFEILVSIAGGIYYYEEEFPIHNQLQDAAKVLSGIRSADEDETDFIRAIGILKQKINEDGHGKFVLSTDEAIRIFREGGLTSVEKPAEARSILRKLGFRSGNHRVEGKQKRGYEIPRNRIEDLFQRYGGTFSE